MGLTYLHFVNSTRSKKRKKMSTFMNLIKVLTSGFCPYEYSNQSSRRSTRFNPIQSSN